MDKQKEYWQGIEELNRDPEFLRSCEKEFPEELPEERIFSDDSMNSFKSRRDFLTIMGIGIGSAAFLSACTKVPIKKAVPYLLKPEEITPGVANWYASACNGCSSSCATLVKTREGRPIKIEGNPDSDLSQGALCAKGQGGLLGLYDDSRLKGPMISGQLKSWKEVDEGISKDLSDNSGNIRILTSTVVSPSTKKVIGDFITKFPNTKHYTYDAISYSAIIKSHEANFDKKVLPNYSFDKADCIVSFGADFLGTWISPVRFTRQYTSKKNAQQLSNKSMSQHIQFESYLSLTGSNADKRYPIKPSEEGVALSYLYMKVAEIAEKGVSKTLPKLSGKLSASLDDTAKSLWENKNGKSIVVSGSSDVNVQMLVNGINDLLGNYGKTIDLTNYSNQKQGTDDQILDLIDEIKNGDVKTLILYGINPAYDFPDFPDKKALSNILTISFASYKDESASLCKYICPDNHYLESWNDYEPRKGYYHIGQPTVNPIFDTRQAQESLLKWSGKQSSYLDYLKNNLSPIASSRNKSWEDIVHDGILALPVESEGSYSYTDRFSDSVGPLIKVYESGKKSKFEITLYESIAMSDGRHANNPWLQEMPDPISKVTWDNYIAVSPKQGESAGWKLGDILEVKIGGKSLKLPVVLQPGQAHGTFSIALGYGRTNAGQVANNKERKKIGENLFQFVQVDKEKKSVSFQLSGLKVEVTKTGESHRMAQTQIYHTLTVPFMDKPRDIIKEATFEKYKKDPEAGNKKHHKLFSLFAERPDRQRSEHSWGMVIDLNTCTGCSACIISCNAENNVAVVGKEEVANRREMHWMRIDRYYSGDKENPEVAHQPMMCHHCDNAPCETVCPVIATSHTMDGLNHQAYNRCVGTRYCANNCPYKVRRFNWFEYANNDKFNFHMNDKVGSLVFNPDVTVRSRGVMEKCSMCIQRIQAAKLVAKKAGKKLADGDIKMACEQSCPGNAIVFGDLQDPNSRISQLYTNQRKYHVLDEIKTLPSVAYLTKIRNS